MKQTKTVKTLAKLAKVSAGAHDSVLNSIVWTAIRQATQEHPDKNIVELLGLASYFQDTTEIPAPETVLGVFLSEPDPIEIRKDVDKKQLAKDLELEGQTLEDFVEELEATNERRLEVHQEYKERVESEQDKLCASIRKAYNAPVPDWNSSTEQLLHDKLRAALPKYVLRLTKMSATTFNKRMADDMKKEARLVKAFIEQEKLSA